MTANLVKASLFWKEILLFSLYCCSFDLLWRVTRLNGAIFVSYLGSVSSLVSFSLSLCNQYVGLKRYEVLLRCVKRRLFQPVFFKRLDAGITV